MRSLRARSRISSVNSRDEASWQTARINARQSQSFGLKQLHTNAYCATDCFIDDSQSQLRHHGAKQRMIKSGPALCRRYRIGLCYSIPDAHIKCTHRWLVITRSTETLLHSEDPRRNAVYRFRSCAALFPRPCGSQSTNLRSPRGIWASRIRPFIIGTMDFLYLLRRLHYDPDHE